ncbi:MAG TPA: type II secretion system protein [Candidatus Paceibacterota bacterium]|nr:type II secretion system protein [Candidatus Paceibacterota bacterium]
MKNTNTGARGFTLIELLVVIAIIGILSAVVLTSLNSARTKARDARRLSDLAEMAKAAQIIDNGKAVSFVGCTAANAAVTTCTTPDLSKYKDPAGATTACTGSSSATCEYSVKAANSTTENFEICTYLENGGGPSSGAGLVNVNQDGTISTGC